MLAAHGLDPFTMLPEDQQPGGGLRQGDYLLPQSTKLRDPKRPWIHQKTKSDSVIRLDTTVSPGRNGTQRDRQDVSPNSFAPSQGLQFEGDKESHVEDAAGSYITPSDTVNKIQTHSLKDPPGVEVLPRVPSPIQLPFSIPPPAFIPPPPTWSKKKLKIPDDHKLLSLHASSEMEDPTSTTSFPEPQKPTEVHGPPQRLIATLRGQDSTEDSAFDVELGRIQARRLDIWTLRSKIREMRLILREKQLAKSTADDKLLQRFSLANFGISSQNVNQVGEERTLEQLMKDCRDARGEYGPIEDDCSRLEDQLSAQEFELTRIEKQFYRRWKIPPSTTQDEQASTAFPALSPTLETALEADGFPQDHPLVVDFLTRLGDLDLLQEQLVDLEEEKESLEDRKDFRLRVGLPVALEDQNWLENSQSLIDEVLENIRVTEADVERLKQDCLSQGLIDEFGEPTDFQSQVQNTFQDEEDINYTSQKSEYVKHPKLLPHPIQFVDLGKQSDEESDSLGGRISHWMLSQLRMSALDVNLLERMFEKEYGETDDRWGGAVLSLWFDDGTINIPKDHANSYASSMKTQAAPKSEHSSTFSHSRHKSRGDQSYHIIVTSRLRLPPSLDHSDSINQAHITPSSRKNNVHWNSE